MDLASLANQMAVQSQSSNRKASGQLLPKQQDKRSYQDVSDVDFSELILKLEKYKAGEYRGKWILQFKPEFPMGVDIPRRAQKNQLEKYAKDYLETNTGFGEEKFVEITRADLNMIEYTLDHEAWFRANFSRRPRFKPPTSLYWKYYKDFPRIIYVNNFGSDLRKFVQARFEEWIDKKKSYLKHKEFRFIEKIAAKLFNFRWDFSSQRMYAHLKYTVILGSLALYMSLYHDKDASKYDIKKIQRKASNFSDVKRLDRYIKKLK